MSYQEGHGPKRAQTPKAMEDRGSRKGRKGEEEYAGLVALLRPLRLLRKSAGAQKKRKVAETSARKRGQASFQECLTKSFTPRMSYQECHSKSVTPIVSHQECHPRNVVERLTFQKGDGSKRASAKSCRNERQEGGARAQSDGRPKRM